MLDRLAKIVSLTGAAVILFLAGMVFTGKQIWPYPLLKRAEQGWIAFRMRYLDPDEHMLFESYAGRGAEELQYVVEHVTANDTSFGVSHWPRSGLENAVYETAQYINYKLLDRFPVGEDVKVMGLRDGDEMTLTIAMPLISTRIADAAEYSEVKQAAQADIQQFASQLDERKVSVVVNTADDVDDGVVYLTLTGTSAEMGDDGAVGRGNRVNGVIAPFRSASLEAPCGKNPVSHVGKVYNVLALLASREIVEKIPQVRDATVHMLSQIGAPLDQPLVATASIRTNDGKLTPSVQADVEALLNESLAGVDGVRERILRRELQLF